MDDDPFDPLPPPDWARAALLASIWSLSAITTGYVIWLGVMLAPLLEELW